MLSLFQIFKDFIQHTNIQNFILTSTPRANNQLNIIFSIIFPENYFSNFTQKILSKKQTQGQMLAFKKWPQFTGSKLK